MPSTTKKKKTTKAKKPRRTTKMIVAGLKIKTATGLPATWKCGNHEPADIATSILELVELTREKGCRNWQAVK